MTIWQTIKNFYNKSGENRTQFYQMIGTFLIPAIVLFILYAIVMHYFPSK